VFSQRFRRDAPADVRFCEKCGEVATSGERARRRMERLYVAALRAQLR
jgi:hypothetical protein